MHLIPIVNNLFYSALHLYCWITVLETLEFITGEVHSTARLKAAPEFSYLPT